MPRYIIPIGTTPPYGRGGFPEAPPRPSSPIITTTPPKEKDCMFTLPPEYQTRLDELGLSYRLAHQSANLIRDKWTGKFDEDPEQDKRRIKCEIVEIGTNKAIGITALGMDEPSAVIAAVDLIPDGYKSSSPAAALSEMAELRAKLAKYEAAETEQPAPKPATKKGK